MAMTSSPYSNNWLVSVVIAAAAAGRRPVHRPTCVVESGDPKILGSLSANLANC